MSQEAQGSGPILRLKTLVKLSSYSLFLQVPASSNRTFIERVTQPLLNFTGQARWALNNMANTVSLCTYTVPMRRDWLQC